MRLVDHSHYGIGVRRGAKAVVPAEIGVEYGRFRCAEYPPPFRIPSGHGHRKRFGNLRERFHLSVVMMNFHRKSFALSRTSSEDSLCKTLPGDGSDPSQTDERNE